MFKENIKPAILIFLILTIITGVVYPLLVTGIAQICFYKQANGSLIYKNGKIIGSSLIGQNFDDPKYFFGRPSSTSPAECNASSSAGSNFGPSNPAFIDALKARVEKLRSMDPENKNLVPVDLVTSSASGLDPHISLAAAYYQVPRIARERRLSQDVVKSIIYKHTAMSFLGFLGERVVNVLELNLELDAYGKA